MSGTSLSVVELYNRGALPQTICLCRAGRPMLQLAVSGRWGDAPEQYGYARWEALTNYPIVDRGDLSYDDRPGVGVVMHCQSMRLTETFG